LKKQILLPVLFAAVLLTGCAGNTPLLNKYKPTESSQVFDKNRDLVNLVYPKTEVADSVVSIANLDSVFLFGSVSNPGGILLVNGEEIAIHQNGGWLAWTGLGQKFKLWEGSEYGDRLMAVVTIQYSPTSIEYFPVERESISFEYQRDVWFLFPPEYRDFSSFKTSPFSGRLVVNNHISPKIRCGWPGTYDIFPLPGTVLWCDGYKDTGRKFYRVPLGMGEVGWIEDEFVDVDTTAGSPKNSLIYYVNGSVENRTTRVHIPLNGDKVPFRVERTAEDRLELTLYGAASWTDVILQPFGSKVVNEIRWRQVDPSTYKLTAHINPCWLWGWDVRYENNGNMTWEIYQAPESKGKNLKNLTILVDAGHGGSNVGALGPTGSTEKQVTLPLALAVEKELEKTGAEVIMTRTEDVYIGLYDRVKMAGEVKADLVLSLHYNALPQGQNPHRHHGTSVHYYHSQSFNLASSILEEIRSGIGWEGDGLRYQDLAIPRLTECPSVLIENAFLSHPEEEFLSMDKKFQQKMARCIRKGLEKWFADLEKEQE